MSRPASPSPAILTCGDLFDLVPDAGSFLRHNPARQLYSEEHCSCCSWEGDLSGSVEDPRACELVTVHRDPRLPDVEVKLCCRCEGDRTGSPAQLFTALLAVYHFRPIRLTVVAQLRSLRRRAGLRRAEAGL